MKSLWYVLPLFAGLVCLTLAEGSRPTDDASLLGLPPVMIPEDNPQTPEKVALGEKLFHDKRFSSTGEISCATCHDAQKAFTDSPLPVSQGIEQKEGTRNAPTVINAVYFESFFWDGRSPSLEEQSLHPFVNPVEMGLENHDEIIAIVRSDPEYVDAFEKVFGKSGVEVTMDEVTKALAAFERTLVAGNSAFDRWYFGGQEDALTESQKRGFDLFVNEGRCVSCHLVEETTALFTDNRFHNVGVGINDIQDEVPELAKEFMRAKATLEEVDREVLTDPRTSELGRFVMTRGFDELGAFKTPTLRNIALTAPYMHDGSLATLEEVVDHYVNGGVTDPDGRVNDFLSGGIRPLDLTDQEKADLVAFMEALTSPKFAQDAESIAANQGGRHE
jgi:cytochrome c peroxidase